MATAAIKIESDIPMPPIGKHNKYCRPRLADMKVGDSFFVPRATHTSLSAVRMESRANQIRITCRTVTERRVKGIRVWRIA